MNKNSFTLTVTNQALIVRYKIDRNCLSGHLVRYLNENQLSFDVSGPLNPLFGSFRLPLALFSVNSGIDVRDQLKNGNFVTNNGTNVRALSQYSKML